MPTLLQHSNELFQEKEVRTRKQPYEKLRRTAMVSVRVSKSILNVLLSQVWYCYQ